MSRVVNIKGKLQIQNLKLALESIDELSYDIAIKNNQFTYNKYDYYDGIEKENEIQEVEALYLAKFNEYLEELEEKERLRIEEEKRIIKEEKYNKILVEAKKNGYKLKKELREDNTIKLVLQRRVY